jgi:hypothetical protein
VLLLEEEAGEGGHMQQGQLPSLVMIRDYEYTRKRIWAKAIYNISYEMGTGKFSCECPQFLYKGWCKHLTEFKKQVEWLVNDKHNEDRLSGIESDNTDATQS